MTPHPLGWDRMVLGDLAELVRGVSYRKEQASATPGEGLVPILRANNIQSSLKLDQDLIYVPKTVISEKQWLKHGDIVIAASSGSISVVGKSAQLLADWVGAFGAFCTVLRPRAADPRFLAYRVSAPDFRLSWSEAASGTNINNLKRDHILRTPIDVPPIEEQRRIVQIIEKQFSRLDAAEAYLARAKSGVAKVTASSLQAAFNREDFRLLPISEFASVGSGATPLKKRRDYYESGKIPWVTSGRLVSDYVSEPSAFITPLALAETAVKVWPSGTLLVAMYGEGRTRGHCSELAIESTTNQACAAIVLHEDSPIQKAFLKLFFKANYEKNRRLASGGVQPNLSLGIIKKMEVPCPSAESQEKIANELVTQVSIYEKLSSDIEHNLRRCTNLRSAILTASFSGQLSSRDFLATDGGASQIASSPSDNLLEGSFRELSTVLHLSEAP